MLLAEPTKNGTGITISGDHGDLQMIYKLIEKLYGYFDEKSQQHKNHQSIISVFSYEIRHANKGDREIKEIIFEGDQNNNVLKHFAFKMTWPEVLFHISILRFHAGYIETNKLDQAAMYMLEHVYEDALFLYDPQGAMQIKDFIGQRVNILHPHAYLIYRQIYIEFVSQSPGKRRFRNIPQLIINHFNEQSMIYKRMMQDFEASAKLHNCKIDDLEFTEEPAFVW